MNNKTVLVLAVLLVVGITTAALMKSSSKEDFWDIPSRTWKVERVLQNPSGCKDSVSFYQTPHYQGLLSPRFSNVNYGPNIRTQLPYYNTSGVPADPLGGDVGGSFSAANSGCVQQSSCCSTPGPTYMTQMDTHNPCAYSTQHNTSKCKPDDGGVRIGDDGVEGFQSVLTQDGELKQPIVYDRYMYANRQSRLRSHGDPIRGDLPIVPNSGNWFTPNVHPNIDLQAGAMNVLGGVNNETNHQVANLIYHTSGGGDTTIGGVDMTRMNMANQIFGATSAARGDVIMTSYP